MVYYNPYILGWYNPLYTPNNQGFGHCSIQLKETPLKPSALESQETFTILHFFKVDLLN